MRQKDMPGSVSITEKNEHWRTEKKQKKNLPKVLQNYMFFDRMHQ